MLAGQFATMVRDLADAFLGPWRLGNGRDARLLRDDEGEVPARSACAFAAVKVPVAFDMVGIVAAVAGHLIAGSSAGIHAAECRGLETRFVPVDLAWFTKSLSTDELQGLCVASRGWKPTSAAIALRTAVLEELAARKHAVTARERAREEEMWVRLATVRYAAEARRRIRAREAGKRRRRRSIKVGGNRGRGGGAEQAEALRPLQQVPD
jgi:hypothetical protein